MKISVLIGTRDRPRALRRCLQSIEKQSQEAEVVVLDDSPRRSPAESTVREFTGLETTYIRNEGRAYGVAGGRNRLAEAAHGDVLCFLDDDAEFAHRQSLSRVRQRMESRTEAGAIAFQVRNIEDGDVRLRVPFSPHVLYQRPSLPQRPQWVSYFLGCHAVQRHTFFECGGFDENLHFGEEELDFAFRLLKQGERIWYDPDVAINHYPEASALVHEEDGTELYHHVQNRLVLAYRHLPLPQAAVYAVVWIVFYARRAVASGQGRSFVRGLRDGIQQLDVEERAPISASVAKYVNACYGRLWY